MGDRWWRGEPLTLYEHNDPTDNYVMAAHTCAGSPCDGEGTTPQAIVS